MSLPAKSLTVRLSGLGKINRAIKLAMKPIENMINGNIFGLMEKYRFIKNNRYRLTTIVTPNKRKNSKLLLNKLQISHRFLLCRIVTNMRLNICL